MDSFWSLFGLVKMNFLGHFLWIFSERNWFIKGRFCPILVHFKPIFSAFLAHFFYIWNLKTPFGSHFSFSTIFFHFCLFLFAYFTLQFSVCFASIALILFILPYSVHTLVVISIYWKGNAQFSVLSFDKKLSIPFGRCSAELHFWPIYSWWLHGARVQEILHRFLNLLWGLEKKRRNLFWCVIISWACWCHFKPI